MVSSDLITPLGDDTSRLFHKKPPFSFRDPLLLEDRIQGKWLFQLNQLLERHTGLAGKTINQG